MHVTPCTSGDLQDANLSSMFAAAQISMTVKARGHVPEAESTVTNLKSSGVKPTGSFGGRRLNSARVCLCNCNMNGDVDA